MSPTTATQVQLQPCASKQRQDVVANKPASQRVHGDGNCLFRAASVSVFGHEDAYSDIRKKVASMSLDRVEQVVMPFPESN